MKVLIIEDEKPAAKQLSKLLAQLPNPLQPMDVLDSVESSVKWLRTFPDPDLIFMDIQIADGLSFSIFEQVELRSPVIFTTAFDHYAVQAFKVNAIDYLLKPIDPAELERAVQKVQARQHQAPSLDMNKLLYYFSPQTYKDRFLVKIGQQLNFVATTDIAFFRSSDGLTQAYTTTGKKHFIEHTLEELEKLLDPRQFFRISRGILLGLSSIKAVHPHFNGRLKIDTNPNLGEEVYVSRERVNDFKAWLGG
jgi:two-component system, LytTR family, response regulator LytT